MQCNCTACRVRVFVGVVVGATVKVTVTSPILTNTETRDPTLEVVLLFLADGNYEVGVGLAVRRASGLEDHARRTSARVAGIGLKT